MEPRATIPLELIAVNARQDIKENIVEMVTNFRINNNNYDYFKIKMSDRNFTQRFDVVMSSLSSDKKITVQQCCICGERCDCSLTYLFKQIVSRGWNPIARSG